MKNVIKILIACLLISTFCSCSVQEKMNSEIFIERFSENCSELDFNNTEIIYDESDCKIFIKNDAGIEFLIELKKDDNNNINKLNLVTTELKAESSFISVSKKMVETYSPDDSSQTIINELFTDGKIKNDFVFFETQWYYYSAAKTEKAIYFSIENKKLSPEKNTDLTLKPNDIDKEKGSD